MWSTKQNKKIGTISKNIMIWRQSQKSVIIVKMYHIDNVIFNAQETWVV